MAETHLGAELPQPLAELPSLRRHRRCGPDRHPPVRHLPAHRLLEHRDRVLERHQAIQGQELLAAPRVRGLEHAQMTARRGRHVPGIGRHRRFAPLGFGSHPSLLVLRPRGRPTPRKGRARPERGEHHRRTITRRLRRKGLPSNPWPDHRFPAHPSPVLPTLASLHTVDATSGTTLAPHRSSDRTPSLHEPSQTSAEKTLHVHFRRFILRRSPCSPPHQKKTTDLASVQNH